MFPFTITLLLVALLDSTSSYNVRPFEESAIYSRHKGPYIEGIGTVLDLNTFMNPRNSFGIKLSFQNRLSKVDEIKFHQCLTDTDACRTYQYDLDLISSIKFNPNAQIIVMVGGYRTGDRVNWEENARDLWLQIEDTNVIIATWREGNSLNYDLAVSDTPIVARQITIFLYYLAEVNGFRMNDPKFTHKIHIIGHSLGAHIAGFVGQDFSGGIGRITGLDPAGPHFHSLDRDQKLDRTDAMLVTAIHTNAGHKIEYFHPFTSLKEGWFGLAANVGHLDYYANDGIVQPNCLLHDVCSHNRAYGIYLDILRYQLQMKSLCSIETYGDHRLLAFSSDKYQNYIKGYRDDSLALSFADFETLKLHSKPLDLLIPFDEFKEQLKSHGIDIENSDYSSDSKYFFSTRSSSPYIGDHFLLKLDLFETDTWRPECSLEAKLSLNNIESEIILKIDDWKAETQVMAVPFVQTLDTYTRRSLDILINSDELSTVDINSLFSVFPQQVKLTISKSEVLIKRAEHYLIHFLHRRPDCQLNIKSIEVKPMMFIDRDFSVAYSLTGGGQFKPTTREQWNQQNRFMVGISDLEKETSIHEYETTIIG